MGSMMKVRILIVAPHRGQSRGSDLVDPVDELGPPFAQRTLGCHFIGFTVGPGPGGVHRPVGRTNPVGVNTVEVDEMLAGLGDMDEDAGQKFEGVDEGIVVVDGLPALRLVEQEL